MGYLAGHFERICQLREHVGQCPRGLSDDCRRLCQQCSCPIQGMRARQEICVYPHDWRHDRENHGGLVGTRLFGVKEYDTTFWRI